jgi:hypothetical protein
MFSTRYLLVGHIRGLAVFEPVDATSDSDVGLGGGSKIRQPLAIEPILRTAEAELFPKLSQVVYDILKGKQW